MLSAIGWSWYSAESFEFKGGRNEGQTALGVFTLVVSEMALLLRLIVHPTIPMAFAPAFIGVKQNSVPMAFKMAHTRKRAGYAVEFAEVVAVRRRRKGICWIENKIYGRASCTRKAPAIPLDMLKVSVSWIRLCQNAGFIPVRP